MIENLKQNSSKEDNTRSTPSEKFGFGESEKKDIFAANRTTILMGLAFLAGLGWIVVVKGNVKPFVQSETELSNSFMVEMGVRDMRMELPRSGRKLDPKVDRMLDAFNIETSERQIPVNELKKNPFLQYVPYVPEEKDLAAEAKSKEEDQADLAESIKGLKLQMTLVGGGIKSATISGFVMHEGDVINGWKVLEIKQDKVVIENSGKKHVLDRNLRPMNKSTSMGKQ